MHLMVDLETMGTSGKAAIVQIGAAWFSMETGEIFSTFKRNVTLESSMRYGLEVDHGAIEFWMKQKNPTWLDYPMNLADALDMFGNFFNGRDVEAVQVWSHASFDMPILENAHRSTGRLMPFDFRRGRDIRTLYHLAEYTPPDIDSDKKHDSMADCEYQIRCCVEAMRRLKAGVVHFK